MIDKGVCMLLRVIEKHFKVGDSEWWIYDPESCQYVGLEVSELRRGVLDLDFLEPSFIFIRYLPKKEANKPLFSEEKNKVIQKKKINRKQFKSKERTISEVI